MDSALVSTLGESASTAVKFYLQVPTITKDPTGFTRQLEKFFQGSEAGAKLIESQIKKNLVELMKQSHTVSISSEKLQGESLARFIDECKNQFLFS